MPFFRRRADTAPETRESVVVYGANDSARFYTEESMTVYKLMNVRDVSAFVSEQGCASEGCDNPAECVHGWRVDGFDVWVYSCRACYEQTSDAANSLRTRLGLQVVPIWR